MRIALIVDNPTRDLDGLVLLARELAKQKHLVFLVPMYSAGYEIPLLACDFALFNYARQTNKTLLQALHQAGIKIGILDTEGGIWESSEQFVKSVAHQETMDCIDQYYFWGPVQHQAFLKLTSFKEKILTVTGCPRYDFCVAPWNSCIKVAPEKKGYVLIISNFALSNPRYSSPETEINNMIAAGYDRPYAEARAADEKTTLLKLIDVIQSAARRFPEKTFVVRTHPFENETTFKKTFKDFTNVKIVREGPVSMWLKPAALTLHVNSSVGVDAALMGVPLYSADWISTSVAQGMSELPLLVSQRLTSLEDFFSAILNPVAPLQQSSQQKSLEDWFYLNDGKAHLRVSQEINNFLQNQAIRPNENNCRALFFAGGKSYSNLIGKIDALGRLVLGGKVYRWFRNRLLTKNFLQQTKSDKFFSVNDVAVILQKLNQIDPSLVTALEAKAAAKHYPRALGDSVLVSLNDFKNL